VTGPATGGWFVLVAGWPAAGKSTLARALAAELGLPLLAKDEIRPRGHADSPARRRVTRYLGTMAA
jgi:predicted kinase